MSTEITTEKQDGNFYRQLLVDGEEASHLWVIDNPIHLLGTEVSMAGWGGVRTHGRFRGRGLARELLSDTVRWTAERGWQVSMLFGIPDFYNKFGFAPCLPEHVTTVATRDAERAGEAVGDYSARGVCEEDWPLIADLYNARNRPRPGPPVRERESFSGFPKGAGWHTEAEACAFGDGSGDFVGYAAWDKDQTAVKCVEADATEPEAYPAVLSHLASMAIQKRCGEIELHMPGDHPFVAFVRRYGCTSKVTCQRMGGGMMRILNQDELLDALAPGIEGQLRATAHGDRALRLTFATDLGETTVALNEGAGRELVCRANLPQQKLMQLLVGYRPASALAIDADVEMGEGPRALLDALFCGQEPYVWLADRF